MNQSATETKLTIWRTLNRESAELHPAYFALVMATGIVSIACHLLGMDFLAFPLFYLNQFFYAVLWLLFLARLFRHFPRVLADLSNHNAGAGFFTLVAGTNVPGSQFVILSSDQQTAFILWLVGFALWLVLIYAFFTLMTLKEDKPPLEAGINGAWLVAVVSTQSLAVLGALIAPRFGVWVEAFFFAVLCFYLLGCMFYILIISLIFYRFMFFKLNPQDFTPPYWINMVRSPSPPSREQTSSSKAVSPSSLNCFRSSKASHYFSGRRGRGGFRSCSSSACGVTSTSASR